MAFDQRTNPPSASEDGYDASRSTCSDTALDKLESERERWWRYNAYSQGEKMGRESAAPWRGLGMDRGPVRGSIGRENEDARTCIPGLSNVKRPMGVGSLHGSQLSGSRLSGRLEFSTQHRCLADKAANSSL